MARKLPKIITQEEFELLFEAVKKDEQKNKGKVKKRIREIRVAILLGFEAGMRISEIVGLNGRIQALSQSQIEGNSIRILSGKGQKDRIVPKPKRMNESIIKMLPLKVQRRTLQRYITALGKKVLKKHITFHHLRHGFGSHLINFGRPIHEVQAFLGHSRLDTTGIYLHANPKAAIEGAREVFD